MPCVTQIEQVNRDRIINFCTSSGQCSSCGNCCSNVLPLTATEIKSIKRYVKKKHITPEHHTISCSATDSVDWLCPFRDEVNKRCNIYEARPAICRLFKCDGHVDPLIRIGVAKVVDVRMTFFPKDIVNDDRYQGISKVMLAMAREAKV